MQQVSWHNYLWSADLNLRYMHLEISCDRHLQGHFDIGMMRIRLYVQVLYSTFEMLVTTLYTATFRPALSLYTL